MNLPPRLWYQDEHNRSSLVPAGLQPSCPDSCLLHYCHLVPVALEPHPHSPGPGKLPLCYTQFMAIFSTWHWLLSPHIFYLPSFFPLLQLLRAAAAPPGVKYFNWMSGSWITQYLLWEVFSLTHLAIVLPTFTLWIVGIKQGRPPVRLGLHFLIIPQRKKN